MLPALMVLLVLTGCCILWQLLSYAAAPYPIFLCCNWLPKLTTLHAHTAPLTRMTQGICTALLHNACSKHCPKPTTLHHSALTRRAA
jgi:hypothetical protein